MRESYKIAVLILLVGLGPRLACAQDAAESAVISGNSSMATQSFKVPSLLTRPASKTDSPKTPASADAKTNTSPNLIVSPGVPPAEANRKAFESGSGQHPAKMLLRSVPANAEVFVNDLTVGRAPLLLVVAPGTYKVGMRGQRQEWGDETVGVMPDETQVVLIHLRSRYPSSITLH